jgi:hypothetical protein
VIPIRSYQEDDGDNLGTYDVQEFTKTTDGGISCRFFVSRGSQKRGKFEAGLLKKCEDLVAVLKGVTKRRFAWETDAQRALEEARKSLRKHRLWKIDLTIEILITEKNPRKIREKPPSKDPGHRVGDPGQ